jgi:hypothetical protein
VDAGFDLAKYEQEFASWEIERDRWAKLNGRPTRLCTGSNFDSFEQEIKERKKEKEESTATQDQKRRQERKQRKKEKEDLRAAAAATAAAAAAAAAAAVTAPAGAQETCWNSAVLQKERAAQRKALEVDSLDIALQNKGSAVLLNGSIAWITDMHVPGGGKVKCYTARFAEGNLLRNVKFECPLEPARRIAWLAGSPLKPLSVARLRKIDKHLFENAHLIARRHS